MNLKFIEALVLFLLESVKPLSPDKMVDTEEGEEGEGEEEEDIGEKKDVVLSHQVSSVSRTQSVVEKESKMTVSVKIVHPLVALLEDARQSNSPALVCQVSSCPSTAPSV